MLEAADGTAAAGDGARAGLFVPAVTATGIPVPIPYRSIAAEELFTAGGAVAGSFTVGGFVPAADEDGGRAAFDIDEEDDEAVRWVGT